MSKEDFVRRQVRKLHAYVPGEQIIVPDLVRLNTNENPYPPAPEVLEAIKGAVDGRLRRYPSATADGVRKKLAELHGCKPENILVGNGSDEVLELAVRTYVEPLPEGRTQVLDENVCQQFSPSYSLYPVLEEAASVVANNVSLGSDFALPSVEQLKSEGKWNFNAALSFITTPNAPTGTGYATVALEKLCAAQNGVVLLDEAYTDFAEEHAMDLALKYPNVLVARTFSKAYCLCFQRVGYIVGSEELIGAMHKIRGSYNVNGLGQIAAEATLDNLGYYRANFERIKRTRQQTTQWLSEHGFYVYPSQTNFVYAKPLKLSAEHIYKALKTQNILIRWWSNPEVKDFLRISIGTEEEMERFRKAVSALL